MNRRQIALKLVLHELGMDPTIDTFDDRLILQKTVYLLQQIGIPLGYHYSWYLRGPYSRDLTIDAFTELQSEMPEGWSLDHENKSRIAKIKSFIEQKRKGENPTREFEKLASVLFMIKTRQASTSDIDAMTKQLQEAGKNFTREEVDHAINELREKELLEA